jgi:hypothetical protein
MSEAETKTAAPCGHRRFNESNERRQDAVPPTVIMSTFSVGWPTPTGTL